RRGVSIVLRDRHAKQRSGRCADSQLVTNGSPFLMLHRLSRRQDTQTVPDLRENAMTGSFQPATTPMTDGLRCRDDAHATSAKIDAPCLPPPASELTRDECSNVAALNPWSSIVQSLTGEMYRPQVTSYGPGDRRRFKRAARQK